MPKVYVVHEAYANRNGKWQPAIDFTPAAVYGQLEVLVEGRHEMSVLTTGPTIDLLRRGLKDFTEDDYLLPVGDPILIGMASVIASENSVGKVSFLKWDRQTRQYIKSVAKFRRNQ